MEYAKVIKDKLDSCYNENPRTYALNINDAITYIKENVITDFFNTNGKLIKQMADRCSSDYIYRSMTEYATDTRECLNMYKDYHMMNLLEFSDATYDMVNEDIILESVQSKIPVVKHASENALDSVIGKTTEPMKYGNIIDNIYTLIEFCQDDNNCYKFYEDTVNDVLTKSFKATGDYERCQEQYADIVLESCASAISTGLIQSIVSFDIAKDIYNTNRRNYIHDKAVPKLQLF